MMEEKSEIQVTSLKDLFGDYIISNEEVQQTGDNESPDKELKVIRKWNLEFNEVFLNNEEKDYLDKFYFIKINDYTPVLRNCMNYTIPRYGGYLNPMLFIKCDEPNQIPIEYPEENKYGYFIIKGIEDSYSLFVCFENTIDIKVESVDGTNRLLALHGWYLVEGDINIVIGDKYEY